MSVSGNDDDVTDDDGKLVDVSCPTTSENGMKSKEKDYNLADKSVEFVEGGSSTDGDFERIGRLIDKDISIEKADGTMRKMKNDIEKQ